MSDLFDLPFEEDDEPEPESGSLEATRPAPSRPQPTPDRDAQRRDGGATASRSPRARRVFYASPS